MKKYPLNVTVDTNIFEAAKFDFSEESVLGSLLKNINKGKIHLVLSDIVVREVEKHIADKVSEICGKAKRNRKEILKLLPETMISEIGLGNTIYKFDEESKNAAISKAIGQFRNFLQNAKTEQLGVASIELAKIVDDYFDIKPPFQDGEKKRKEFPDAFIAAELIRRFGNETVAIITQDNGLKDACAPIASKRIFNGLDELFNFINKENYELTIKFIKNNEQTILNKIEAQIDDSIIEVSGLSYDRKGVVDGHEYDETWLEKVELKDVEVHSVDDVDGDIIIATMAVRGDFIVNCYYNDYDNAPWDSEAKEYLFVEEVHIIEKHDAIFACRAILNMDTEEVKVLPFRIVLGGDSREERKVIEKNL